jgi:hypothetical protein
MSRSQALPIESRGDLVVHLLSRAQFTKSLLNKVKIGVLGIRADPPGNPVLAVRSGPPVDLKPDLALNSSLIENHALDDQA